MDATDIKTLYPKMSTEEAIKLAAITSKYRLLCIAHHAQEFDKLPDTRIREAVFWQTVDSESCDLCKVNMIRSIQADMDELFPPHLLD